MDQSVTVLGLLSFTITAAVIRAQPQYRVFVDPPATVTGNTPNDVTDFQVFICAREFDSSDTDIAYCPLGNITLPSGSDFPRTLLDFGEGSETLAGPYPTITTGGIRFRGIGLAVGIGGTRNGDFVILGTHLIRRHVVQIGETAATGFTGIDGAGVLNVIIGVVCLPGYSGVVCNTIITTTTATTIMEELTTTIEQLTTEQPTTEQPTTVQPTTEELTTEKPETTFLVTPTPSGVLLLGVGIGIGIGLVIAAVTAVLSVAITCCIFKRKRRLGPGKDDADDIETSRIPVYGTGQDNSMTTNADIKMSRNPVYGTRKDNSRL